MNPKQLIILDDSLDDPLFGIRDPSSLYSLTNTYFKIGVANQSHFLTTFQDSCLFHFSSELLNI